MPCHKDALGSGGTAPCTLNLGIRWRWVVSFTVQRKSPWYPLATRLGRPHSKSGCSVEEKKKKKLCSYCEL